LKKDSLPEAVVKSLGFSLYPSFSEAGLLWDHGNQEHLPIPLNELFMNQMITTYEIIRKENLSSLKLLFDAKT
jgi:hypothetical protein